VRSKLAAASAVVVLGLAAGIAAAVPADAAGEPHAFVGMAKVSYTSARAPFGISFSAQAVSFDVRRANSSMRARHRASWVLPARLQDVPVNDPDATRRVVLPIGRGRVVCVSARVRDVDGNVGPWSDDSCEIRAIDDAALTHHGHTRVVRDSRYWGGRATELDRRARMRLTGVPKGSRVLVLVTDLNQNDPRFNGRNLPFTVPARRGLQHYTVGWRFGPTRYTQVIGAARPSGRRGPIVFHGFPPGQSPRWTSPLEGVVVQPPWV
jgi:hypothetical protein